jgi:DNA repair exonuclease SbcCD ATPase subunit
MIIPQQLKLTNWATWEKVAVPLSTPGITFIRGRNEDDGGNPNYAGKSCLLNSIYALIYGQHQLAIRKNSIGKIIDKSTIINYMQQIDDHKVSSILKDSRLKVFIDGEAIHTQKKNDERVELQTLMNTSAEMYTATRHLNGVAANPLLRGSSSARCNFLEKAFDLDRWSNLYSSIGDTLSAMNRADNDLETIKADLIALNFEKIDVEDLQQCIITDKTKLAKVKKIIANTNRILGMLENLPEKIDVSIEYLEIKISNLEKEQEDSKKYEAEIKKWKADIARRKEIKIEYKRLASNIVDVIAPKNLDLKIAQIQEKIEQHLQHSENCPVCGNSITTKVDANLLNKVRKVMGEASHTEIVVDIKALKSQLTNFKNIRQNIKNNERLEVEQAALRKQLASLNVLKRPTGNVFTEQQYKHLKQAKEDLFTASRWEKAGKYASYSISDLEKRLEKASALEEKLNIRISKNEIHLNTYQKNKEVYVQLHKRQKELEEEIKLRPIYKALKAAYSPNGMRLWLLQELLEALIAGLNENIHSTRDFKTFGYKLSRNRELILTATNLRGTYDLYMLSGAEGVLFTLNLLTVLLPMLPASKRSSMLILDDMDAMCSTHVRNIIADVYLSRLKTMVDSLFFLTPTTKREFAISDANEWLVVKKNNTSTLEM